MTCIKTGVLAGMVLMLMQACGSNGKEAELPVRKACNLERLYKDMPWRVYSNLWWMSFVGDAE